MIYQLRESPFFKDGIPNQVGNDITDKFQGHSGSSTGMTEGLRVNFKDIERDTFCLQHLYVKISMEV